MLVLCMAAASQQALAATVTFQVGPGYPGTWPPYHGGRSRQRSQRGQQDRPRFSRDHQLGHSPHRRRCARSSRAGLYNNALGTDTEPPLDAFVAVFPALGADSWITTPWHDGARRLGRHDGRQQLVVRYDQRRPADQLPVRANHPQHLRRAPSSAASSACWATRAIRKCIPSPLHFSTRSLAHRPWRG